MRPRWMDEPAELTPDTVSNSAQEETLKALKPEALII
jgi:hypothetical protein